MTSTRGAKSQLGRRAAVVCLLLFALSLWAPPALTKTAPKKAEAGTAIEAWYYVADDSQEPPVPPPFLPDPVNPYGEDTLHVGITAGREDSRTYISLNVKDLPVTFKVVEGTLTLPIAEDNGTINAEQARVQVCLATPPPKSEQGSFDEPPEVDCKTKAPAQYRKKPYPHLEANLAPFGEDLAFSALAILPSKRAVERQDTWHVAFYAKKSKDEEAKPIEAALSYVPATTPIPTIPEAPAPGGVSVPSSEDFGVGDAGSFESAPDTGFGTGGAEVPADQGQPAPASNPVEITQAQPAAQVDPGYTIVWALPLILLALYFYFGSALTREIVIRGGRS